MGAFEELVKALEELKSNLEQYQRSFQPRCESQPQKVEDPLMGVPSRESQPQKVKDPLMGVPSKVATQLKDATKGKKIRSCKSLSSAEIFAKWDKGLCEWCDEPYSPGHTCTKIGPNTLFVVVAEEEDPMQHDFGVENPSSKDAPQVFDESPEGSMQSHLDVGANSFVSPLANLMKLKQVGTVKQYQESFEALLTEVDLPIGEAVSCFLSGLREEIQTVVRMFKPQTLYDAICMAKLQEATLASIASRARPSVGSHSPHMNDIGSQSKTVPLVGLGPQRASSMAHSFTGCNSTERGTLGPEGVMEDKARNVCSFYEEKHISGQKCAQEGLEIVPCEQLGGLNPSNGLFEKSISSIHDKDPDLSEQEEISEDANAGMSMDEELHMLAGYSKALGLQSAVPKLQDLNLLACWISKNPGWRKANDVCVLVFDPGILGPGQSALQPDIVVFNSALNACVPSHQWKAVSWVFEQLKKGGLQTNGATYGLAIEVRLHSKMYELCLVHELDRKRCYWGYCCETLATEDSRRGGGEGIQHMDANVEYCSVIKRKLGAHCSLRGVEMVCCDSTDYGRRFYVELKASRKLDYHTEVRYEREKLLKFWIQSFLAGIPYIVVGFRDDSGRLVRTERMRTKDITYRVKMKGYWQGGVSLAFADEVLCWLYGTITKSDEQMMKETVVRFAFHSGDIADESTAREVEKTHPQEAATDADTGNQGVEESAQVDSTAEKMEALAYEENEAPDEVKEDTNKKCHWNVVLIDHVDAGQTRIAGRTLNLSRQGDEKTVVDKTRGSWYMAYLMDTNEEERAKGITTEVGTETTRFTILDASGHKRYVPNLINGASQADVGIVVFSVRKREFETGSKKDVQFLPIYGMVGSITETRRDGWFEKLIPIATAQQEQQESPGWKYANSFCFIAFAPGGTLPFSTRLPPVSHTIHDLEAVRTVFDPGGKIISRYVGPSPSESRAVIDIDELGSADIGELSVSAAHGSARLSIFSVSAARPLLKVSKIPEKSGIWSCLGMGYHEDAFQMQRSIHIALLYVHQRVRRSAVEARITIVTPRQSPPLALQPWVVFDLGGMIFLLIRLLLHTIHTLDAEGAVFYPGKRVVLGLINTDSSWSEAGKREVMEVWICASPRASSIVSLSLKLEDKLLEGGRLIRAKGSHVRGMRLVVRVSWEFADSARDHQFVRQLAGKMPFSLPIKAM